MDKKEYYKKYKKCGLKVGDEVIVTRKAKSYENGWPTWWDDRCDILVGKKCIIKKMDGFGPILENSGNSCLPYFVLKKVKPVNLPDHLFEL